jgi:mannose-6-phosphate isomerase-like protein (cupin superfamily)
MWLKNAYKVKGVAAHGGTVHSWRVVKGEEINSRNLVFIDDDIVAPGKAVKAHRDAWDEVYYIMNGFGEMRIDGEKASVKEGDAIHIPPGKAHSLKNTGTRPLRFICVAVKK